MLVITFDSIPGRMSYINFDLREEHESQEWVQGLKLFHDDDHFDTIMNVALSQIKVDKEDNTDACLSPLVLPSPLDITYGDENYSSHASAGNTPCTLHQSSQHSLPPLQHPSSTHTIESNYNGYDNSGQLEGFIPTEYGVMRVTFPIQSFIPAVMSRSSSAASIAQNNGQSRAMSSSSSAQATVHMRQAIDMNSQYQPQQQTGYTIFSTQELESYGIPVVSANASTNVSSMQSSCSSTPVHETQFKLHMHQPPAAQHFRIYREQDDNEHNTSYQQQYHNRYDNEDSDSEENVSVWEEQDENKQQYSWQKNVAKKYKPNPKPNAVGETDRVKVSSSNSSATRQQRSTHDDDYDDDDEYADDDSNVRDYSKPRKKASEEARNILMNWLVENEAHPYPTKKQKQDLANASGMSLKQIVHWMSNIRKRRMLPLLSGKREASSMVDVKFLEDMKTRRASMKKRRRDE